MLKCEVMDETYGKCNRFVFHSGFHTADGKIYWPHERKPCKWCSGDHTPSQCLELAELKIDALRIMLGKS